MYILFIIDGYPSNPLNLENALELSPEPEA